MLCKWAITYFRYDVITFGRMRLCRNRFRFNRFVKTLGVDSTQVIQSGNVYTIYFNTLKREKPLAGKFSEVCLCSLQLCKHFYQLCMECQTLIDLCRLSGLENCASETSWWRVVSRYMALTNYVRVCHRTSYAFSGWRGNTKKSWFNQQIFLFLVQQFF